MRTVIDFGPHRRLGVGIAAGFLAAAALLGGLSGQSGPGAAQAQPRDGNAPMLGTVEVLLRIEQQQKESNARLAELVTRLAALEKRLDKDVPVRIVEPLPPGLRGPAERPRPEPRAPSSPAPAPGDKPATDPHPGVHPSHPKDPSPSGPR